MIIEIALGVALGLLIFANWSGLLALSTFVALFSAAPCSRRRHMLGSLLGCTGDSSPPTHGSARLWGSSVIGVVFWLLLNVLLAFGVGSVIEQRLHLGSQKALGMRLAVAS